MSIARKAAIIAVGLATLTGAFASEGAFAQTNRYTRIEANTAYLGPDGVFDRGLRGPIGPAFAPVYGGGYAPYPTGPGFGGPQPFIGGY